MKNIEIETRNNREKLYRFFQRELNIYQSYDTIKYFTLQELDLTNPEINLLLNQLEATFNIEIQEGTIALELTVDELMHRILRTQKKLEFDHVDHVAEFCV